MSYELLIILCSQGPQGVTGTAGAPGVAGEKGSSGDPGSEGEQGKQVSEKLNQSTLFNEGNALTVLRLTNLWPSNPRSNWNLEVLVFVERGKPEYPAKKPLEQG